MPRPPILCATLVAVLASGCTAASVSTVEPAAAAESVRQGVRATLDAQVQAWNAGSVRGFMDGYARADSLTFLSGGTVRRGWQQALDGYVRGYPDASAMGQLTFSDLSITPLSATRALCWGRWRLQREADAPGAGPGGLFTLVMAETPGGWRVVHDHTSSE